MTLRRLYLVLTLLFCAFHSPLHGQTAATSDPQAACKALYSGYTESVLSKRFANIPDAPTSIVGVKIVASERGLPELCQIEGQIAPTIGFLLKMPLTGWNGKLLMGGCGGPCGMYLSDRLDPALARHYAVVSTDMGHKGVGWLFAYQNLQGQIDFGSRATHLTAVAAKVIVDAFYNAAPKQAYFSGCSTGGRQAVVEAQRFPNDFSGIIAGAPPYFETGDTPLFLSWGARVNVDDAGNAILSAAKLPMIHKAVMQACGSKDNPKENVLQNPLACNWSPQQIVCKAGTPAASCLTPKEADVVQKIYDGASNSKGYKLYFGMARGSELDWTPGFINTVDGKPGLYYYGFGGPGNSLMTYGAYFYSVGPTYQENQFNYDTDLPRLAVTENLYNAQNPDLRAFKEAGGKLILYHGWNDNQIPPQASVDYYQTASRVIGGSNQTKEFFRLFMLPGVGHCRGGLGGGEVDWITALEDWVEKNKAPEQVTAYHPVADPYPTVKAASGDTVIDFPHHPLAPSIYNATRPVYPFPDVAHYKGTGDPAQATSWEQVTP